MDEDNYDYEGSGHTNSSHTYFYGDSDRWEDEEEENATVEGPELEKPKSLAGDDIDQAERARAEVKHIQEWQSNMNHKFKYLHEGVGAMQNQMKAFRENQADLQKTIEAQNTTIANVLTQLQHQIAALEAATARKTRGAGEFPCGSGCPPGFSTRRTEFPKCTWRWIRYFVFFIKIFGGFAYHQHYETNHNMHNEEHFQEVQRLSRPIGRSEPQGARQDSVIMASASFHPPLLLSPISKAVIVKYGSALTPSGFDQTPVFVARRSVKAAADKTAADKSERPRSREDERTMRHNLKRERRRRKRRAGADDEGKTDDGVDGEVNNEADAGIDDGVDDEAETDDGVDDEATHDQAPAKGEHVATCSTSDLVEKERQGESANSGT